MPTSPRSSLLPAAALLLVACDVTDAPIAGDLAPRSTPSVTELQQTYCAAKRQLAVLGPNTSECPQVSGWDGSKSFPQASGELSRFCRYDWAGGSETEPDVQGLGATSGLFLVASDCAGVADHSVSAIWDVVGPEVAYAFHYGIGRATAEDLVLTESEASRTPVVVAVVDTVPDPRPTNPRSAHGEFMVQLVEDIACPAGNQGCAVQVLRVLGLPRYIGPDGEMDLVDDVRGGYYGTQRDIAKAIYDAVEIWKDTDWGPEPAKLIINLSVGWDRELFGDANDPLPRPSVLAVYAALEHARCQGALVIAAAGNQGYSCGTGPVVPAKWETHAAPDEARCAALGDPPPPAAGSLYSPLVYSVGGLTHDLQEMARSRVDGMPRLAALSTNAVIDGSGVTLTGTSVGSAVTAGAASLVWSFNPDLTPAEVMSLLYHTGTQTSLVGDYAHSSAGTTNVRAVDACAALEAACNRPAATCPSVPFDDPLGCLANDPPETTDVLFAQLDATNPGVTTSTVGVPLTCADECGQPATAYLDDASGTTECPEPTSMKRPYTLPQPTQIGCLNCTLDLTDDALYASLDPKLEDMTVTDATVSVVSLVDGVPQTTYFRLGPMPQLTVNEIEKIELDSEAMPATARSASIALTFDDETTIVDPLLLGY